VRKLEGISKVNEYLDLRLRRNMLRILKRNLEYQSSKYLLERKAVQFRVKYHKYFLLKQTLRVIRSWKMTMNNRKETRNAETKERELRRMFERFKKGIKR